MKLHGAIFDMDGTVTDSMFVWKDIGVRYVLSLGLTPPENLSLRIKNMSMQQVSEYFSETFGLNKTPLEITDDINALAEPLYRHEVAAKAGVIELIEEFKARGVKMCIATATDRHIAEIALKNTCLLDYFSEIFTCTNVGAGKDLPVIYEKALEHLGTKKCETLVFEDALYAIRTAKSAGFPVVGVFDTFSAASQNEIKSLSDFYINDYRFDSTRLFERF